MGSFILIDKFTNSHSGLRHDQFRPKRRASNIHWQAVDVNHKEISRANSETPTSRNLGLLGLSGSGKSTIANLVEKKLHAMGKHTYLLDGDNVRHEPQQRPWLHRRRPGRKYPPNVGEVAQADGRSLA